MTAAATCPLLSALIWTLASVSSLSLSYPPPLTAASAASLSSASSSSFQQNYRASGECRSLSSRTAIIARPHTLHIEHERCSCRVMLTVQPAAWQSSARASDKVSYVGILTSVLPVKSIPHTSQQGTVACAASLAYLLIAAGLSVSTIAAGDKVLPLLRCISGGCAGSAWLPESVWLLDCCPRLSRCSLWHHALSWGFPVGGLA